MPVTCNKRHHTLLHFSVSTSAAKPTWQSFLRNNIRHNRQQRALLYQGSRSCRLWPKMCSTAIFINTINRSNNYRHRSKWLYETQRADNFWSECTLSWQCKTSSQRNNLKVHHPGRIPSMNKSSCSWSHTSDLVLVVLAQMSTRWVLLILFLVLTCTARYRWISSVVWILMICWESFGKWKSFQSIVNGHPKRYSANTY